LESRVAENLANMESRVGENLANMESRSMKNSDNMQNLVMQDSRGKKSKEGNSVAPRKRPAPRWCPSGITEIQQRRLQKMRQRELDVKKVEEERDYWFHRLWPMTKPKQMWREKRLANEEGGSSGEEASKVTPARGNLELQAKNCSKGEGGGRSVVASWVHTAMSLCRFAF
jgi:hypothetical protein